MFQYSSKTFLMHLEVKLESFLVDLRVDHVTQSENFFINCINCNNPTYYSSYLTYLIYFFFDRIPATLWRHARECEYVSVTLLSSRSWRCVLVVKGGPPLPLFSDWMQQERMFSCMAAGILHTLYDQNPFFAK